MLTNLWFSPQLLKLWFGDPHRVLSLNMVVTKTSGAAKFIMTGNKIGVVSDCLPMLHQSTSLKPDFRTGNMALYTVCQNITWRQQTPPETPQLDSIWIALFLLDIRNFLLLVLETWLIGFSSTQTIRSSRFPATPTLQRSVVIFWLQPDLHTYGVDIQTNTYM